MNILNRLTARFGPQLDPLGFGPAASPTADEWVAAFTDNFIRHPTTTFGTQALMSGLRFYSPPFIAEIGALGPVEARYPAIPGYIPQAIYTAVGPIICRVYAEQISRNAGAEQIEAAFTAAMPELIDRYSRTWAADNSHG
jgi:hypothetical protein